MTGRDDDEHRIDTHEHYRDHGRPDDQRAADRYETTIYGEHP